jgi:TolB-like protein
VRFHFENLVLDAGRRELLRDGAPVAVEPQVFDLVLYLVENRDRVVSKDDVLNAVWHGRIVSESTLTTRINAARKALGDSGEVQRLIRTLPRKGFRFVGEVQDAPASTAREPVRPAAGAPDLALALPDRPSIAVLPFQNLSSDPEQNYFADGIVEDIITALSRFKSLFVIARNSSFTYKGKPVDIRQVGRELGVRYLLEGSVRKAGNKVRISAQLIEAETGNHIWADRYDRQLEDLFALQEEMTQIIVRIIEPRIQESEALLVRRRRPQHLGAYELAITAREKTFEAAGTTEESLQAEALVDARAALALDPTSTLALDVLAQAQLQMVQWGAAADVEAGMREGLSAANRSVALDPSGGLAHSLRGAFLVLDRSTLTEGLASLERGYDLNPNSTLALMWLAYGKIASGDPAVAMALTLAAIRSSPRDPRRYFLLFQLARASFGLKDYDQAISYLEQGIAERPRFAGFYRHLALCLVSKGEIGKARLELDKARALAPGYVERGLAGHLGYGDSEQHDRALRFLHIAAGLPATSGEGS